MRLVLKQNICLIVETNDNVFYVEFLKPKMKNVSICLIN